jgi:hypothetical protein
MPSGVIYDGKKASLSGRDFESEAEGIAGG